MTALNPHLLQALVETRQRDLLDAARNHEIAMMARAVRKAERRASRAARRSAAQAGTADVSTSAVGARVKPNRTLLKLWPARRRTTARTPATLPGS